MAGDYLYRLLQTHELPDLMPSAVDVRVWEAMGKKWHAQFQAIVSDEAYFNALLGVLKEYGDKVETYALTTQICPSLELQFADSKIANQAIDRYEELCPPMPGEDEFEDEEV